MDTQTIVLSDYYNNFIKHEIEQGGYASASDVVKAGLQLLADEEEKRQKLISAIEEGENSGPAIEKYDWDESLKKLHAKYLNNGV